MIRQDHRSLTSSTRLQDFTDLVSRKKQCPSCPSSPPKKSFSNNKEPSLGSLFLISARIKVRYKLFPLPPLPPPIRQKTTPFSLLLTFTNKDVSDSDYIYNNLPNAFAKNVANTVSREIFHHSTRRNKDIRSRERKKESRTRKTNDRNHLRQKT